MTRASFGITTHITYQKAILDLDPDLCQNFRFFVTSSILHIETCMIPLSKAVHKGFISFFLHLRALSYLWGRYDPKTEKKLSFLLVTVPFLHIEIKCNTSTESFLWRASFLLPTLMSYEQYMRTLWPKSMKIWWLNRALCGLIYLICSKRLIF